MSFEHDLPLESASRVRKFPQVVLGEDSVIGDAPHIDVDARNVRGVTAFSGSDRNHAQIKMVRNLVMGQRYSGISQDAKNTPQN